MNKDASRDELFRGSDTPIEIQLIEERNGKERLFDLTNATEILARFLKEDNTSLEKKMSDGGVVVKSATSGDLEVVFQNGETKTLAIGKRQDFEVVVYIDGKELLWPFFNALNIKERPVNV